MLKCFARFLARHARGKLLVTAEAEHQTIRYATANDDIKLKGHQSLLDYLYRNGFEAYGHI